MLELLPPDRDPATGADVAALEAKVNALDAKVDARTAALDAKVDAVKVELEVKIDAAVSQLTALFREEIQRAIVTQTRITVFSMVTAFAAVSALALGLN